MLADKSGMRRKPKGPVDKNGAPIKPRTDKENKETLQIFFATIGRMTENSEQRAERIRGEIAAKKTK